MKHLLNKFFYKFKKKKIFFINNKKSLDIFFSELEKSSIIGIDTEFDWRNTYFPKLSIMQVSSLKKIFLIDCLKIHDLDYMKEIVTKNNIRCIFHSVRSDSTVLSKSLGIKLQNVFDIQLADTIINSCNIKSYGKIVKDYLGLKIDKSETNSNWLKRPLTSSQLKYCSEDVNYLIDIYKIQKRMLSSKNLFSKVLDASKKEANLGNSNLIDLRLRKNSKFSSLEKKIFIWRENLAIAKNVPPSYLFKDNQIFKLSKFSLKDENLKKKIMAVIGDTFLTNDFIKRIY